MAFVNTPADLNNSVMAQKRRELRQGAQVTERSENARILTVDKTTVNTGDPADGTYTAP